MSAPIHPPPDEEPLTKPSVIAALFKDAAVGPDAHPEPPTTSSAIIVPDDATAPHALLPGAAGAPAEPSDGAGTADTPMVLDDATQPLTASLLGPAALRADLEEMTGQTVQGLVTPANPPPAWDESTQPVTGEVSAEDATLHNGTAPEILSRIEETSGIDSTPPQSTPGLLSPIAWKETSAVEGRAFGQEPSETSIDWKAATLKRVVLVDPVVAPVPEDSSRTFTTDPLEPELRTVLGADTMFVRRSTSIRRAPGVRSRPRSVRRWVIIGVLVAASLCVSVAFLLAHFGLVEAGSFPWPRGK